MAIIWSSTPGEGWLDALFPSFTWMQVYDRRSTTPIPVVIPPSGGTQPLVPVPAPVQVPTVVPAQQAPIFNPQPPPTGPIGPNDLPPGTVSNDSEENVALEDWFQTGVDLANIWGRTQVSQIVQGPQQYVSSVPAATAPAAAAGTANGLPAGMYMDKHGHLVHRRRRRRPCITQTDLSLAWQISNLPNNANVKMFLAKCVK